MVPILPRQAGIAVVERATAEDVQVIAAMVNAAFSMYIERLGKLPAAMIADYEALVASKDVYVLRTDNQTVGAVLLTDAHDSLRLSNLVVDPTAQGRGYSRVLMDYAYELAHSKGLRAVTLFTNALMHENISLYTKFGFKQTERKSENGYDRIYFRKNVE